MEFYPGIIKIIIVFIDCFITSTDIIVTIVHNRLDRILSTVNSMTTRNIQIKHMGENAVFVFSYLFFYYQYH